MARDPRDQYFDVWNVYWPIALGVFVLIALIAGFLLLRNRSREGGFPRGRDKNEPLEIAYALGLACIAAFLTFLTFSNMPGESDPEASGRPVEIEVTASRWNWRFVYPEHGIVEQGTKRRVPVLRVPVDTPVELSGSSLDVIHSFWIPEERFKRDLFPEIETRWSMVFDDVVSLPGGGKCAEFCGLEHSRMLFNVLVMPKGEFARWAAR